jgi:hypothetical protein
LLFPLPPLPVLTFPLSFPFPLWLPFPFPLWLLPLLLLPPNANALDDAVNVPNNTAANAATTKTEVDSSLWWEGKARTYQLGCRRLELEARGGLKLKTT